MGYREFSFSLPTTVSNDTIEEYISKVGHLKRGEFSWHTIQKSLDARKKSHIVWQMKVAVTSPHIKGGAQIETPDLAIPKLKKSLSVAVVGSGPAGIFAATVLAKAGAEVSLFERGLPVDKREESINRFEQNRTFDSRGNYAFGEGGAGTFSDGKLTARSKRISVEKNYILRTYVAAGAPEEILYFAHPHIGSDNLKKIAFNMRENLIRDSVSVHFGSQVVAIERDAKMFVLKIEKQDKTSAHTRFDAVLFATGHSAFDANRMLMNFGVPFQPKPFALGVRVEHLQETINIGRWRQPSIPGVKAAEYRLTHSPQKGEAVYTFCMCPGGKIVPATAFAERNIVNGMSLYARDGQFANSAVVATLHPDSIHPKISAEGMLDYLDRLEHSVFAQTAGYDAPANTIAAFLDKKIASSLPQSSYPFNLVSSDFHTLLPQGIAPRIERALQDFNNKVPGFSSGTMVGVETKTSSSIQVKREKDGTIEGFSNLFVCGEGSGWSGGIISSAADGIKAALSLLSTC